MGSVRLSIPAELAVKLRDAAGLRWLVETGTYKGGTARWAATAFEHVVSIEGYRPQYDKNVHDFGNTPNLRLVYGDSRTELAKALPPEPVLLWLDAHWLGNYDISRETPGGECPLREELKSVRASDLVLIDDARLFVNPPNRAYDPHQWPTIAEIKALLPGRYIAIFEDVIIAIPHEYKNVVEAHMQYPTIQVVVATSNKYCHLIAPFAHYFDKFWDNQIPVTVVRYDVRPPKTRFYNIAVGNQADFTWSAGIAAYLDLQTQPAWHFAPDLFVFMLEDYFLSAPANAELIRQLWRYMADHPEIAKIDLSGDVQKRGHSDYGEVGNAKLVKADDDSLYQTSTQAAIWRREYMRRYLRKNEDTWQFERAGSKRVIKDRQSKGDKTPGLVLGVGPAPLAYINAVGGEGKAPGQYDLRKIPAWMQAELREHRWLE